MLGNGLNLDISRPYPPSAPPAKLCATPNMTGINPINLLKEIITKHTSLHRFIFARKS